MNEWMSWDTFIDAWDLLVRHVIPQFLLVIGDDVTKKIRREKMIADISRVESQAPIVVAPLGSRQSDLGIFHNLLEEDKDSRYRSISSSWIFRKAVK